MVISGAGFAACFVSETFETAVRSNCTVQETSRNGKSRPELHVRACFSQSLLLYSVNTDLLAVSAEALKTDNAVDGGINRIVAANTGADTGMDMSAALTHEDIAGQNKLTVSTLHAKTLGLGITAVLGGAAALFMGKKLEANIQHRVTPPKLRYNPDTRHAGRSG